MYMLIYRDKKQISVSERSEICRLLVIIVKYM